MKKRRNKIKHYRQQGSIKRNRHNIYINNDCNEFTIIINGQSNSAMYAIEFLPNATEMESNCDKIVGRRQTTGTGTGTDTMQKRIKHTR